MIAKIILSVALGFLIGFEREYHGKAVGVRTVSLITLGATLFCLMSSFAYPDSSRVVAQIVSGIGFLGGGIIFKNGDEIKGLTTAATVWAAAAIGCLVGMNMPLEAFFGTVAIVTINIFFQILKTDKYRKHE